MVKKKGSAKEAKVNTPIQNLDQKETLMHYNAVLIEEQNSKFQIVLERMDVLAAEVRENSKRLTTVEHAIRGLKDDMIDMERRICSKINRITDRCERHECRLNALEANQ